VVLALRIDAVNGFQELKRRCLGIQASSILTASSITSRTLQNASESSPVRFFVFGKICMLQKKSGDRDFKRFHRQMLVRLSCFSNDASVQFYF